MELARPRGADSATALGDSFEAPTPAYMPAAARPTAPAHALFETAGGGGAGSAAFLGDAARVAANEDKTTALVLTCSVMLSIALLLRLCAMHMQRSKYKARRVCCNSIHFKTMLHALDVSVYVVLWYAISIGMTLFNKWFLRVWADGGYPFSTTMTCINMFIKCVLSRVMNACSSSSSSASISRALTSQTYWRLAVPIGLCTALDIMLSNLSFFYITVTFYTIVKSGGNVWNLLFSICLGHQRPSYALVVVILLISSGLALASYGSTQFVFRGFVLVLAASVIGTLRWVLTQSLLKAMDESSNRILAVVYYISPASALGLLPIALVTEGPALLTSKFVLEPALLTASMAFIFVSGCLAFVLIFVEILLVKKTSALSLGIAGSFKDVTQVLLAVLIFDDRLTTLNAFGLVVATSGMLFYTSIKHSAPLESDSSGSSSSSRDSRIELPKYTRVPTAPQPEDEDDDSDDRGTYDTSVSTTTDRSGSTSRRRESISCDGTNSGGSASGASYRHEIQVINLDEHARNLKLATASTKREDALVRRESKDYHTSSSSSHNGM